MKKLYAFFFSLILTVSLQGQIISIGEHSSNVTGPPTAVEITNYIAITNTSDMDRLIKVKRNVIQQPANTENWFCWELCFTPWADESPDGLVIAAGETSNDFIGYFGPNGVEGTLIIEYCWFDANDPSIESCATVQFTSEATSSAGAVLNAASMLGAAFPNPAVSQVSFNYDFPANQQAEIVIYDLLGSVVVLQRVQQLAGRFDLDVSSLNAGVYVYAMRANGETIATRKMVIAK
jgi:hypothetical protein